MSKAGRITSGMIALLVAGCMSANDVALEIGKAPDEADALRSMGTTEVATSSDEAVLRASTSTLQDFGFTILESSADLGVLAGSKQRDAETVKGVAGAVALTFLFGAGAATWDKSQQINVTLVVSPGTTSGTRRVRVLFDRSVTNNRNEFAGAELITDPTIYQQFLASLKKTILLEGR